MMTLEEMWESLRQDPETKATMEEVDKSYKLLKKIENLIIADLEAKLEESEKLIEFYINSGKEQCDEINKINHRSIIKSDEIDQLKQQLAETDKLMQEYLSKCLSLEQQLAEKEKEHELLIDNFEEETENLRKQIKQESDARKRFVEEVKNLKQQLAEKDEEETKRMENFEKGCQEYYKSNQTAIAVLEEMLDNEVYINSKLDFEDGNYVLSKIIRTKIEELRNGRN